MHTPAAWLRWCLLVRDASVWLRCGFNSGCGRSTSQSWWVREELMSSRAGSLDFSKSCCCSGLKPAGGKRFPCAGPVRKQGGVCAPCWGSSWPPGGRSRGLSHPPWPQGSLPQNHSLVISFPKLSERCLRTKRTKSLAPVALSEPAEELPVWPGRSCHLPSSLN